MTKLLLILIFGILYIFYPFLVSTMTKDDAMPNSMITSEVVVAGDTVSPNASEETSNEPPPRAMGMNGIASYYDYILESGWSSRGHYVCATRDFKRYSFVKVTNIDNGKSITCRVTDYGPDASIFPERIVDLSSTAFSAIASLKLGIINVNVKQL